MGNPSAVAAALRQLADGMDKNDPSMKASIHVWPILMPVDLGGMMHDLTYSGTDILIRIGVADLSNEQDYKIREALGHKQ